METQDKRPSLTTPVGGSESEPPAADVVAPWRQGWFWRLGVTASVFAMCAHFQTFNTAVTNSIYPVAHPWLVTQFGGETGVVATHWGLMNSVYLFGTLIGFVNSGWIAEWCGRKNTFYGTGAIMIISGLLMSLCKTVQVFHLATCGRLLLGMAVGVSVSVTTLLMAETAPKRLRGTFFGFLSIFFGFGVLIGYVVSLPEMLGTTDLWPLAMATGCFPALFLLPVLLLAPESPRYLYVERGDKDASRRAVIFYQGEQFVDETMRELELETRLIDRDRETHRLGLFALLTAASHRRSVLLVLLLNASVQTTGIVVLITYSTTLLEAAGAPHSMAAHCTLLFGVGKLIGALFPPLLLDTWGRRPLNQIGLWGCCLCTTMTAILLRLVPPSATLALIVTVPIVLFTFPYACLLGSTSVLTSEIFLQNARAQGLAVGNLTLNGLAMLVTMACLPMFDFLGMPLTLTLFATVTVIMAIVSRLVLFETKGLAFHEISLLLAQDPAKMRSYSTFDDGNKK